MKPSPNRNEKIELNFPEKNVLTIHSAALSHHAGNGSRPAAQA